MPSSLEDNLLWAEIISKQQAVQYSTVQYSTVQYSAAPARDPVGQSSTSVSLY